MIQGPPVVQLWTAKECAHFLNTTPDYLKKLRSEKKGPPYFKTGRSVRYHPKQVQRWLLARQKGIEPAQTVGRRINGG